MTVDERVLLAEVLFHVEPRAECVGICKELLRMGTLPDELRASVVSLLGMAVSLEDPSLAVGHIRQANRLAARQGNTRVAAVVGLRLLSVLSDIEPPDVLSALVAEVRKDVTRSMEPHLRALLHLQAAKLEGRRDSLDHARSHLHRVRAILDEHPNVWLESLLEQYHTVISTLRSEVEDALHHAERCRELSLESGAALCIRAAACNIAIGHLSQGHWDKALVSFTNALRIHERTNDVNSIVPLLDGLAQTHLIRGDAATCEALLMKATHEITRGRLSDDSWQSMGLYETRVRLLLFQGRWSDAAQLAQHSIALAAKRSDKSIAITLNLLLADATLQLGDLSKAAALIGDAYRSNERLPWGPLAEAGLLRAEAYLVLGDDARANSQFRRARNILSTTGNASLAAHLISRWNRIFRTRQARSSPISGDIGSAEGTFNEQEWLSSSAPSTGVPRAVDAVDIAALFDLGSHPELLGRELFALLASGAYVQREALVAMSARRPPELLSVLGWTTAEATSLAVRGEPSVQRFDLGHTGNRRYVLFAETSGSFGAQDSLVALHKIVSGILTIEEDYKGQKSMYRALA